MRATSPYRLHVENDTVTLTVGDSLTPRDLSAIVARCRELEPNVVMLKIDLRARGLMNAGDNAVVRAVLNAWRNARGGSFQLTTSHLVASCRQVTAPPMPAWSSSIPNGRIARAAWSSPRRFRATY